MFSDFTIGEIWKLGIIVLAAGGEVIARYCSPFGRLCLRAGDGSERGRAEVGETSSNRSSTTTLGSVRVRVSNLLGDGVLLLKLLACECTLSRRLPGEDVAAYSGSSAKLSGVTTTPNVPGRCVSALRSRSSSVVSTSKAGKSSCPRIGLVLRLDVASAID